MKIQGIYNAQSRAYTRPQTGNCAAGTFADKVKELGNTDTLEISRAEKTTAANMAAANMTMDEYKQHIYDKLSAMRVDPSRKDDWLSVNISEEGFAAMKSDPEYEKWVLDTVQADLLYHNPYAKQGGIIDIKYFGASREDYRCESWNIGYNKAKDKEYEEQAKRSFWELRRKREKMYAELARIHRMREKEIEEEALAKKLLEEENIYSKKAPRFTFSAARDIFSHMDMFF